MNRASLTRALIDTAPGAAAGGVLLPAETHEDRLRNAMLGLGVGLGTSTGVRAARNAYNSVPDDLSDMKATLDANIARKSAAFQAGYYHTMKCAGLRSGIADAAYLLGTGRTRLRHGTTKDVAEKIRTQGLIPQGTTGGNTDRSGIPAELETGMSFLSRSPDEANLFAQLSAGARHFARAREGTTPVQDILRASGVPGTGRAADALDRVSGSRLEALNNGVRTALDLPGVGSVSDAALGRLPGAARTKEVLNVNVPFRQLQAQQVPLSEIPSPTRSTVTLRGDVDPRWVEGSPTYQNVTRDEVRQHLRDTVANPRPVLGEAARQFVGVSHSPREWASWGQDAWDKGRAAVGALQELLT